MSRSTNLVFINNLSQRVFNNKKSFKNIQDPFKLQLRTLNVCNFYSNIFYLLQNLVSNRFGETSNIRYQQFDVWV